MNVFTEWHHGGLFHAMQMLFDGRIGMNLFGPVGLDWAANDFWGLSQNPDTQKQYLYPLYCEKRDDGFSYYHDKHEEIWQRRVSFEQFKSMRFDIILCTLQEDEERFRRLRDLYQPQAKYIRLCGNTGEQVNWSLFDNFIDTTGLYRPPASCNTVQIHQEFPLEPFHPEPPTEHKTIKNFMNQLHEAGALPIWEQLKRDLPEYSFKMHGSGGDDGMIDGLTPLGDAMRSSAFVFMVKHHGEGYGHVIHNAYCVGRPVIAMKVFYKGKMAEHFLVDDVTAIVIDENPWPKVLERIRFWSEPENHALMCKRSRELFERFVNFNEDELLFRKFLERLL